MPSQVSDRESDSPGERQPDPERRAEPDRRRPSARAPRHDQAEAEPERDRKSKVPGDPRARRIGKEPPTKPRRAPSGVAQFAAGGSSPVCALRSSSVLSDPVAVSVTAPSPATAVPTPACGARGVNGRPRTKIRVGRRSCSIQRPPMTSVTHPGSLQVVNIRKPIPPHTTHETFTSGERAQPNASASSVGKREKRLSLGLGRRGDDDLDRPLRLHPELVDDLEGDLPRARLRRACRRTCRCSGRRRSRAEAAPS